MPELPEVETICRGLQPHLEGRRILRVKVIERRLRCLVDRKLAQYLEGKTIVRVGRMAKYILIFLNSDAVWVFHLGCRGSSFMSIQKHRNKSMTTSSSVSIAGGSSVIMIPVALVYLWWRWKASFTICRN